MCRINTKNKRAFGLGLRPSTRILITVILFAALGLAARVSGQTPTAKPAAGSVQQQLAAAELEMTNACARVLRIVNRPVTYFRAGPGIEISIYHPGWFHDGAEKPDFNNVDIRTTQTLNYAKDKYVSSDLNPGIYFLGEDLEFNPNTKWFYADRSRPKRKLTEEEMVEINGLYRVIGKCETEIARLQNPQSPPPAAAAPPAPPSGFSASGPRPIAPGVDPDHLPAAHASGDSADWLKNPWVKYAGYGVLALLVVMIITRLAKNRETWA